MTPSSKIFIAGHRGLVGSALLRALSAANFTNLLTAPRPTLDLTSPAATDLFFATHRPDFVFLAAAKVGGILANATYPADFLRDNLAIQLNVLTSAHRYGVKKLAFLGSSCIYPKNAPQPIKEEYLLTGPLEPTNEWYAIAKIAGIKLCQAFRAQYNFNAIALMPTNLYGPGDNFDLHTSHVLPALLRKFHTAVTEAHSTVTLWGSGTPLREFLHVDDLASASLFLMQHYNEPEIVNIGTGQDLTITALAQLIARITGFTGKIVLDPSKPDGTPRKLLDVSRLHAMGCHHRIELEEGIRATYQWYLQNSAHQVVA